MSETKFHTHTELQAKLYKRTKKVYHCSRWLDINMWTLIIQWLFSNYSIAH
jgi:hypothetical protein